ncbi:hypothetical protein L7F22_053849 [Adiantum nelumboides]|nr:hypothetical protein [Adiantum nelumboides]
MNCVNRFQMVEDDETAKLDSTQDHDNITRDASCPLADLHDMLFDILIHLQSYHYPAHDTSPSTLLQPAADHSSFDMLELQITSLEHHGLQLSGEVAALKIQLNRLCTLLCQFSLLVNRAAC